VCTASSEETVVRERQCGEWAARAASYARQATAKNIPFAEALVALVAPTSGARVLDVATGPGIVAVAAAKAIGSAGSVLATDLVPDWESYVAETAAAAGVTNVAFAAMPAEALALPDASFDVVLCQFGLMFVATPVAALREMWRVLRPGGKLGVTVWSVPEKVGIFLLPRIVMAELPPAAAGSCSPVSMGEPGLIERLVAEAGFRDVQSERQTRFSVVADAEEEWHRWSLDDSSPAARRLANLPESERQRLRGEAIAGLETFRDGEVIRVPSEAILVTAVR
jgi:SAM-dependent methyltransferase